MIESRELLCMDEQTMGERLGMGVADGGGCTCRHWKS